MASRGAVDALQDILRLAVVGPVLQDLLELRGRLVGPLEALGGDLRHAPAQPDCLFPLGLVGARRVGGGQPLVKARLLGRGLEPPTHLAVGGSELVGAQREPEGALAVAQGVPGFLAVVHAVHRVPGCFQDRLDLAGNPRIILDQENAHHRSPRPRVCRGPAILLANPPPLLWSRKGITVPRDSGSRPMPHRRRFP